MAIDLSVTIDDAKRTAIIQIYQNRRIAQITVMARDVVRKID